MIICTMPGCETTAGCICMKRLPYIPPFSPSRADQHYNAEIAALNDRIATLEAELSKAREAALEEAAKVADEAREMRERLFAENGASINASRACQAEEIAAAIRSLSKKEG